MPDRRDGDRDGSPTPGLVDAALDTAVTRARAGDEGAVRHLYRTLQPRLLNYLRAMVGETDAEDVASETWSRIARDLRSFSGNGNDFRAWAVTIARHRAIDHLRRRRPTIPLAPQHLPHQPAREDTERDVLNAIDTAAALAIIGALPPDQAQAILLRVVVGLDTATSAQVLDKTPGAIRTALHRGLRNLARRLQPSTSDAGNDVGVPAQLPSVPPTPTGA
ncbi:RNA polymerase sigma factor [Gandjariella thermophila]|uniref:DNA-directed RNA polymerase sigma-70 factor n=1 Tax=Gandjariella thermophila TaxID=1931992 RepID=A0A4D4JD35_9PSEU|nr:RNA polymerase sigma factor [Gandjariella thermophila]GDY32289.1 DNA-directed RNA polymerase sigma-70 factor [Gandjariella thermophila]